MTSHNFYKLQFQQFPANVAISWFEAVYSGPKPSHSTWKGGFFGFYQSTFVITNILFI